MARMERDRRRRNEEDEEERRPHKSVARHSSLGNGDPARAPKFQEQRPVADGQSINIPSDACGAEVEAFSVGSNLKSAGDANYTGSFKDFVGNENLLPPDEKPDENRGVGGGYEDKETDEDEDDENDD